MWIKIDPYYQPQRCSAMTVVSHNIRLIGYLRGFLGDEASNDSGVIENVKFQDFRTLCLRNLRKWGLHNYIALFSPLSPFHWPNPNRCRWMTLNGHFTGMSRALKPGFRSLATLKLLENVGEHQTETNGIARFPCDSMAFLLYMSSDQHSPTLQTSCLSLSILFLLTLMYPACLANLKVYYDFPQSH